MAAATLRKLAGTVLSEYNLLQRRSPVLIARRTLAYNSAPLNNNEKQMSDVPLKYTGSKAQAWKARQTRSGIVYDDRPWYQPWVVLVSVSTFMIYFCILREESDIDRKFDLTLYDHIDGLEEQNLRVAIKYNQENGIDTKALEARLEEIEQSKING